MSNALKVGFVNQDSDGLSDFFNEVIEYGISYLKETAALNNTSLQDGVEEHVRDKLQENINEVFGYFQSLAVKTSLDNPVNFAKLHAEVSMQFDIQTSVVRDMLSVKSIDEEAIAVKQLAIESIYQVGLKKLSC